MNVLLIQPSVPEQLKRYRMPFMPLGLAYLASMLETNGHDVTIIDMDVEEVNTEYLINQCMQNVDLVGVSVTTWTYYVTLELCKAIKEDFPHIKIVLGGPHVTFTATETLQEAPYVDFIIRGEGERSLVRLLEEIETGGCNFKVPGLSYRSKNEIKHNEVENYQSLDDLPFPARHLLKTEKYSNPAIVTSRGCPNRCRFCVAGAMSNNKYRIRSVKNILDELKTLDRGKRIFFYDNTFAGNVIHSKKICSAIIKEQLNIEWSCELKVDNVDKEFLQLLSAAGCKKIQFGVESGSPKILALLGKGITIEQVKNAVETALNAGIDVYCSFTIGHPEETREDIEKSINLMRNLRSMGAEAQAAIVVPFPGTKLYIDREKLGIDIKENRWDRFITSRPTFNTRHLTRDDIGQIYFPDFVS